MADFSSLKAQRKAREFKSFNSSTRRGREEPAFHDVTGLEVTPEKSFSDDPGPLRHTQPEEMVQDPPIGQNLMNIDTLYPNFPPTLDVRCNIVSGRGIYSKYSRKPGDVLLSIKPHVSSLSNEHLEEYCSNCFGFGVERLRRCTGCKVVSYCDSNCQTSDWGVHKAECAALQRWISDSSKAGTGKGTIPADAIRCLGRILWRKQKLGFDSLWARQIDSMQSHRTALSKDPEAKDSQMYAQLAHAVVQFLGLRSAEDLSAHGMNNAADLVDLISRFTTNTFTVSNPALAPLGACVSPIVALINHSCDPNAVVVFPRAGGQAKKEAEPLLQVVALKPIAANEEVLTAYIDTTLPREIRMRYLKETYHFTCRCSLCTPQPSAPPDLREAMWCPTKCGGVCPLPTEENSLSRCNKCGKHVKDTDAVLDAIRVGQEALEKAEALQFSNTQKAIQLTSNLIPILISANLVPSAHPLLALTRLNTSLLIADLPSANSEKEVEQIQSPQTQTAALSEKEAQEALDEVIRSATRASTGLSQILAPGHPVRGVALAELGKLLAVDEPAPTHLASEQESTTSSSIPPPSHSSMLGGQKPPLASYPTSGPPRLKLAYETLVRARTELVVGFGGGANGGGEVGQSVRQLAVDVEKELSVWKDGLRNALNDRPKTVGRW